jgi:hypothetical protein
MQEQTLFPDGFNQWSDICGKAFEKTAHQTGYHRYVGYKLKPAGGKALNDG